MPHTWNYRIVRYRDASEDELFGLHEVHYEDEVPTMRTVNAIVVGDSPDEIKRSLERMLSDVEHRVAVDDGVFE